MVRYEEREKQRIYVIRSTIEEHTRGSWADCERIYNDLSDRSRTQDSLIRVYKDLDKDEMRRLTRTTEWDALRDQIKRRLHNVPQPVDEPLQTVYGLDEGSRLADPVPRQTIPYPLEMMEQAMPVASEDGMSTWLENYTPEQSVDAAPSPYTTTTTTTATSYCSCIGTTHCTGVPCECTAGPYNEYTSEYSDASLDLHSLDGLSTGAVDGQAMISYDFLGPQLPVQQALSIYNSGTASCFNQQFEAALQRAISIYFSNSAQPATYSTAPPISNFADTDMFINLSDVAIRGSYLDPLEHGFPKSPTLDAFRGTGLEQPADDDRTGEMAHEESPHFSDFPNLSAEAMGHVEILGWDNAQISLSLADLENLLREEESNSASS